MRYKIIRVLICVLCLSASLNAQKTIELTESFNKIVVSPHIETVFIKGSTPSIQITEISIDAEKFNYEVKGDVLQVYLEGAKTTTKKNKNANNKQSGSIYKNAIVKVVITYVDVKTFSIRGEKEITFESPVKQEECNLRLYGEPKININKIDVDDFNIVMYGESNLYVKGGSVEELKVVCYGESKVNALRLISKNAKITTYGEGKYNLNVINELKVNTYGEANIVNNGAGVLKKGVTLGEFSFNKPQ